jgi:hypothetical protein
MVLVAPVAPWNNQTVYAGNLRGDWVQYFADVLNLVQRSGCDGFALHAYTHGSSPAQITSDVRMSPPFAARRYEFRVYEDFLTAVPEGMRELPVYITETDQIEPWADANTGWVQRAYAEIDRWNRQPGSQKVRALVLYRWPKFDRWYIDGKQGVISDFRVAMAHSYRWDYRDEPEPPLRTGDVLAAKTYVNLRKQPGYLNKPADDVVRELAPGVRVTILADAIREVDGLAWWQAQPVDSPPVQGWVAQFGPDGTVLMERVSLAPPTQPPTTQPPTTQPPTQPAPTQPTPTQPAPPLSTLKVGDQVRTTTIVNIRRSPGINGKAANDVVVEAPAETVLMLTAGPEMVDGLIWWRGQGVVAGATVDGWMAEWSTTGQRLLVRVDGPIAPVTPRFRPGDKAMTLTYVRLRRRPGFMHKSADDVVADIWQGTQVTILGGPQVADGLSWWEVETTDSAGRLVRGWMAETAPGGQPLLGPWVEEDRTPFKIRDLAVVGGVSVRVRRSPGYVKKPDDDILGEFMAETTLYLTGGPLNADELRWWRASGVTRQGKALGWVAESAPGGGPLLRRAPKLPGADIPNLSEGKFLGRPFAGQFGISQLWGENTAFYSRYSYEGVVLLGHNGVDFLTPVGAPVWATEPGEVAAAGFEAGGFGNYVLLAHSWGESVYAHLESIGVQVGQRVPRGAVLGLSGNSGGSSGPHLHFAIRIRPYARTDGWGGYSDPLPYMDPKDVEWPAYMLEGTGLVLPGAMTATGERLPPSRMAEDAPGLIRP